jgi:predicted phosphodiesterase
MGLLRRVGIIGDIHGEDARLDAAIHLLRREGIDALLAVGDIADGPGSLDRCCELLVAEGALVVRGNHDRWLVEGTMRDLRDAHRLSALAPSTQAFLTGLPPTRTVETAAGTLLLCHGVGENDMRKLTADDFGYELACNDELQALLGQKDLRFVVGGHTHRRMVRAFGHLTVLNAGTLYRADHPCVLLADFAEKEACFFPMTDALGFGPPERHAL